jgi:type IV secretion system protein VirB4
MWRRKAPRYLPESDFNGIFAARAVDDSRRRRFTSSSRPVFVNTAFVAVHYVPRESDALLRLMMDDITPEAAAVIRAFIDKTDALFGELAAVMPMVEPLEGDALASYLSATADYRMEPKRLPPAYLDHQLGGVEWSTEPAPCIDGLHLRTVELHHFGPIDADTMDEVNSYPFELRWCTTLHCLDADVQRRAIERHRRDWEGKLKGVVALLQDAWLRNPHAGRERPAVRGNIDEIDNVLRDLADAPVSMVHGNIHTWDHDPHIALKNAGHVAQRLRAFGLKARVATFNAVGAPMGDVIGKVDRDTVNPRRPVVPIAAITRASPVTGLGIGDVRDEKLGGPALLMAEASRTMPFHLALHPKGMNVGHIAVVGSSGGGKSTLLAFLALQFLRYPEATVVLFDRMGSFMVPCLCAGGDWLELDGKGLGVQPYRYVDDPAEAVIAQQWTLRALRLLGVEPTTARLRTIDTAIGHVARLHPDERTLSAMHAFMAGDDEARNALGAYRKGGLYGEMFDGVVTGYGDNRVLGVETSKVMRLGAPGQLAVAACFNAIKYERLTTAPGPKLVLVDEAWSWLQNENPIFADQLQELSREIRKLDGTLALATQSLADLRSERSRVVMEQITTKIFTPNARAAEDANAELYRAVGITPEQIDILAGARREGDYLIQQPRTTRLVSIALEDDARRICSIGPHGLKVDHARARSILSRGVKPGEAFMREWLGPDRGDYVAPREEVA